jgi:XTP/dITP diphosphohydrolase
LPTLASVGHGDVPLVESVAGDRYNARVTNAKRTLILGTHNRKKGLELLDLLAPLGIELRTLADVPEAIEVVEDGDTFAANATLKATKQAVHLRQWVLGEDSGLAVDALRGAPGVYSARYAGAKATDADNNRKLLAELAGVPDERRTAHYVCHAVLSDPAGQVVAQATGECHGRIRLQEAGAGGFGYDPLFEVIECHRMFGELSPVVKACLSHRSRALRQLVARIARLVGSGRWVL